MNRARMEGIVVVGLETFPETLTQLFTGENFGKLVLQVTSD